MRPVASLRPNEIMMKKLFSAKNLRENFHFLPRSYCKLQVNTSDWHSQPCGLLLWHSAKVLTEFIKSFISKLVNCSKKVKWFSKFDGKFQIFVRQVSLTGPNYPLTNSQCSVVPSVQAGVHTAPSPHSSSPHIGHTITMSSPGICHSVTTSLLHSE